MRKDIVNDKEKILNWIEENKSKAYICRELKCKPLTLDSHLKKMGILYKGNMGLKGKIAPNKKNSEFYLINGSTITSFKLKNKLLEEGIKEEICECCGLNVWNGKKIPLELHHKDGNGHNNELNNLELLCPNCHAQTSTYRSRNCVKQIKEEKEKRIYKEKKKHFCSCGKEIKRGSKNCQICDQIRQRKVKDRPNREDLFFQVSESSYEAVGRKYKVSGRTIKKWLN
jgi:hypothetical protein